MQRPKRTSSWRVAALLTAACALPACKAPQPPKSAEVATPGEAVPAAGTKVPAGAKPALKVAAAADLTLAFKELGAAYEKETGQPVSFSFGSTGLLAKQIQEGAPFNLFAAANIRFVDDVIQAGACAADSKAPYARGRIVVWTPDATTAGPRGIAAPTSLADLADARFVKVAIANPEHAPYGKAAQQALTSAGVWDKVKPKLVYGENIQQTLQFAQSGNVEAAIVALSLSVNATGGQSLAIAEDQHQPIEQALVVCGAADMRPAAAAFARYVNSEPGRAVMRRYGFLLPGETSPSAAR